ncbi:hypothetical protein N8J89_19400 [Crossiella sp. CA-258035]|uniref:DUF6817 domain-containing protein n=1 Tax=Crossiella sp. CA-258035 TaxID=2981138 RepID=UPI0024BD5C92|nr:hypothetical protein [Crossiella sp. CA-258035]WHT23157.1 hypothetical protein N8J89_19400 [Crossiella sp. CA-258035]
MSADAEVEAWLRHKGTEAIPHPGGTLYAHLCRVRDRLADLGHGSPVQLAGLTHAAYGTDGFGLALLDWQDRAPLRTLIGDPAEELVYRYGSCDRDRSWPRLAAIGEVTDRFTGRVSTLAGARLTEFVDLSIVNELDVIEQDPGLLAKHGDYFRELFTTWTPVASAPLRPSLRDLLDR